MNSDEIKQAKLQAQERIRAELMASQERIWQELDTLAKTTGMEVLPLELSYIDYMNIEGRTRRLISDVKVELRVP